MNKGNNKVMGKLVYSNNKTRVYYYSHREQPYTVWEGEYVDHFYSVPTGLWAKYVRELEVRIG